MADTGERREITKSVNAKETETVQESKKLVSRTKEISANKDAKNRARSAATKRRATKPPQATSLC
jgi:hypothetical protein